MDGHSHAGHNHGASHPATSLNELQHPTHGSYEGHVVPGKCYCLSQHGAAAAAVLWAHQLIPAVCSPLHHLSVLFLLVDATHQHTHAPVHVVVVLKHPLLNTAISSC
jgi:hypothetical protein